MISSKKCLLACLLAKDYTLRCHSCQPPSALILSYSTPDCKRFLNFVFTFYIFQPQFHPFPHRSGRRGMQTCSHLHAILTAWRSGADARRSNAAGPPHTQYSPPRRASLPPQMPPYVRPTFARAAARRALSA